MTAAWLLDRLIAGSLQAIVLVALVWVICRLLPRLPAALMTGVWWLVSLKLLLVLVPLPVLPLPVLPAPVVPAIAPGDAAGVLAAMPLPMEPAPTDWWPVAAALVWFAGVAVASVRLLMAYWSARGVVRRATGADVPEVDALAAAVGLARAPRIRRSAEVAAPQVIGSWRPVIVLPASMPLDGEECRLALGHELMHVRRRDVALGWIPALAERLFFFHPLVRLAAREYLTAREAACDAALVAALGVDPADYGRLLVRFGITAAPSAFAAGGAASSSASLLRRLDMLQRSPTRSSARVATALCAALVVAMVPMKLVARSAPALPDVAPVVLTQEPAAVSVPQQSSPDPAVRGRSVRRPETSTERFMLTQEALLEKLSPGVKTGKNPYSIESYLSPADVTMYREGVRRGFTHAEWEHLQEAAVEAGSRMPAWVFPSTSGTVYVTGVVMPQSARDQQAAAAQAQAAAEAAKAAEAQRAAEAKAAEQQARETAQQSGKELEARRLELERRANAVAMDRTNVQAAVLNEYMERLTVQSQVLQKQMDALRDQIRELERALELQKKELAKKK